VSPGAGGGVRAVVTAGGAPAGPPPDRRDRRGLEVALLWPLAHRARLRWVLAPGDTAGAAVDPAGLADVEASARAWSAHGGAMRVELPDPRLESLVASARADARLAVASGRPDPDLVAALEDWGHDVEAA